MRYYYELQPSRHFKKIVTQLNAIRGLTERVHVPDAPLGYPKASSISIAAVAVRSGFKATAHLRTTDYSFVGFLNQVYGAYILGIDRLLLLRGDPPFRGSVVTDVIPEEGLRMVRSDKRLSEMMVGLIVSLRFPLTDVSRRLSLGPDFVLITHKERRALEEVASIYKGEKIGYLILRTPRNADLVSALPQREDVCDAERSGECVLEYVGLLDAVLVSCPLDMQACTEFLSRAP